MKEEELSKVLHKISFKVFNFKDLIHHSLDAHEIELIKQTALFTHLNENDFNKLVHSIHLVKYPKDQLIFLEGDLPDALFIIVEGSVRVFTHDLQKNKVPLARLNKGDYFGEQALLGMGAKTRNASVEAITDVTLIKISSKIIVPLWAENHVLKEKLRKIGYEQAAHSLNEAVKLYNSINYSISSIEKQDLVEFEDGEVVFNEGEKADYVYLILQGNVEIRLLDKVKENLDRITLHKGNIFGELGVLENKPRSGTAIARGRVRLLALKGDYFREVFRKNPQARQLIESLKKIYQLPFQGDVEQYLGHSDDVGSTLTSIYKMKDGRSITAVRALTEEFFVMSVANKISEIQIEYKHDKKTIIKLGILNSRLINIEVQENGMILLTLAVYY